VQAYDALPRVKTVITPEVSECRLAHQSSKIILPSSGLVNVVMKEKASLTESSNVSATNNITIPRERYLLIYPKHTVPLPPAKTPRFIGKTWLIETVEVILNKYNLK
jgi:hypothetical protein